VQCGGDGQTGGGGAVIGRRRLGLWPKEGEEGAASTEPKGGGVGLGWPVGQGPGRGKATQEEGRGERAGLEGRRSGACWAGSRWHGLNAKWAGKAIWAGWKLGRSRRKEKGKGAYDGWAELIFGQKGFWASELFF
jgi:hypothetical protein